MKKRRLAANLTQKNLSMRLNRPQSFVAKYENGERRIDVMEFIEVADAIGFDPAVFLTELRASGDDPGGHPTPAISGRLKTGHFR